MYIVVVGYSSFALELAKLILNEKKDKVVFVIKRKESAAKLSELLNISVVNDDPTKPEVLDELELDKCDVFICASEFEKENILAAVYAKGSGAKKIFVCIDTPDAEDMLYKLGLTPINSEKFAAHSVELMISRPAVSDLVNIGMGEFDIVEIEANGTKLIGKDLNSAKGKDFSAIATYANGSYNFSKDAKISACDTLLLVVSAGKERIAEKEIGKQLKRRADMLCSIKESFK